MHFKKTTHIQRGLILKVFIAKNMKKASKYYLTIDWYTVGLNSYFFAFLPDLGNRSWKAYEWHASDGIKRLSNDLAIRGTLC